MRSVLSCLAHYVSEWSPILLPLGLLCASSFSAINTSGRHSLGTTAIAWAVVWIYSSICVGFRSASNNATRKRLGWGAGALFALSSISERASEDREGMWLLKTLLPTAVYIVLNLDQDAASTNPHSLNSHWISETLLPRKTNSLLIVVTVTAGAVLSTPYASSQTIALGLGNIVLLALGLLLLEKALTDVKEHKSPIDGFVSINGSFSRGGVHMGRQNNNAIFASLKNMAGIASITCALASLVLENYSLDTLTYSHSTEFLSKNWKQIHVRLMVVQTLGMAVAGGVQATLTVAMVRSIGPIRVTLIAVGSCLAARLLTHFNFAEAWYTFVFAFACLPFFDDPHGSSFRLPCNPRRMRLRQLIYILALGSFAVTTVTLIRQPTSFSGLKHAHTEEKRVESPTDPLQPLRYTSTRVHPVDQLVRDNELQFGQLLARQSKTLNEAVAEYRRRYGIPPPPHFDRWYAFARKKGVQLIDEFDTIHDSLTPFWALKPKTIRDRVREALGNDGNMLLGLMIRDGQAINVLGGQEWLQQALVGMTKSFVKDLPDMDLAFNTHDEPRVVVPHDQLSQMVNLAKSKNMPDAYSNESPKNSFSPRPKDLNSGKTVREVLTSRFNKFAHQATWTNSKLSCSPNSPSRSFEEGAADNLTAYALGEMGFVYNQTGFMDICNSPSLRETFGFFDRPNAYNIVHDLFPIFSQSKISSYQDILYPSPWYWYGKVTYEKERDMEWEKKEDQLYWRGSTTGGFSRNGGWRRQHRQHLIGMLNANDDAKILKNKGGESEPKWEITKQRRSDFKDMINTKFSHVGQCDPGDCDAQKQFFELAEPADQQAAWGYKHLVDIDGNAFSGRFYAFLHSKSLVYKMALFQEWHKDWLKPWVHYIPLSLRGDEWLETVRYFSGDPEGRIQAPRMAMQGREWARKALRNEDFEVWFFRLLLEYGRLVDDGRETIGYRGN